MLRLVFVIFILSFFACDLRYGRHPIEHPEIEEGISQTVLAAIDEQLIEFPNDPTLLRRKVRFLESANFPPGSLDVIQRALEVMPEDGELHYIRALGLIQNDDLIAATNSLDQAGSFGYLTAPYFSTYADVLLTLGRTDRAMEQAERFRQLDPNNYKSFFLMGKIFFEEGDTTNTLVHLNQSFEKNNNDDELNLLLLDILMGKGDTADYQQKLEQIDQNDPAWLMKLALLKFSHGLTESGQADLKQVLLSRSNFLPALLYLADSYFNNQAYDSTIYYADIALMTDSLSISARLAKARALDKKNLYSASIEEYQNLLEIDSTNVNAANELQVVYRKVAYLRQLREEKESLPTFDLTPIRRNNN